MTNCRDEPTSYNLWQSKQDTEILGHRSIRRLFYQQNPTWRLPKRTICCEVKLHQFSSRSKCALLQFHAAGDKCGACPSRRFETLRTAWNPIFEMVVSIFLHAFSWRCDSPGSSRLKSFLLVYQSFLLVYQSFLRVYQNGKLWLCVCMCAIHKQVLDIMLAWVNAMSGQIVAFLWKRLECLDWSSSPQGMTSSKGLQSMCVQAFYLLVVCLVSLSLNGSNPNHLKNITAVTHISMINPYPAIVTKSMSRHPVTPKHEMLLSKMTI